MARRITSVMTPFFVAFLFLSVFGLSIYLNHSSATFIGSVTSCGQSPTWEAISTPFASSRDEKYYAIDPTDGSLYVSTFDQIFKTTDNGTTWTNVSNGLPTGENVTSLTFNKSGTPIAAVGENPAIGMYIYNNGMWTLATGGIAAGNHISQAYVDSSGTIYAITKYNDTVWRSTDGGQSYSEIASAIGGTGALITIAEDSSGNLYTGGEPNPGIYKSSDGGITWTAFALPRPPYNSNTNDIIFNQAGDMVVGLSDQDNGSPVQVLVNGTWTSSTGLPIYSAAYTILMNSNGELFTGASTSAGSVGDGLYCSTDGGLTWQSFNDATTTSAPALHIGIDAQGYLYMSIGGQLYRTQNPTVAQSSSSPGSVCVNLGSPTGQQLPAASITIQDHSTGTTIATVPATTPSNTGNITITSSNVISLLNNSSTYDYRITIPGFLVRKVTGVTNALSSCVTLSQSQQLIPGDFQGSNSLTLADLVGLIAAYNNSQQNSLATVAYTVYDGVPKLSDLVTFIRNYNANSTGD